MLRNITCLVILLVFSVTGLYAHGPGGEGHKPPDVEITESQAIEQASDIVAAIVKKGKLDASWTEVQAAEVQKKTYQDRPEWVITFNNPAEKDKEKQKLYVFLSLYGDFLGANHTGS